MAKKEATIPSELQSQSQTSLPDEDNKHIGLGLIPLASFQHLALSQITSIKSLSPVKVLTKGLNFSPSIYTLRESTMPSIVWEAANLDLIFLLFQFVLHKCFNWKFYYLALKFSRAF